MASEMPEATPPLPVPTPTSRPFWDGLAEGVVRLQRCTACGGWVFYPRSRCSHCLADALEWHAVSGAATLYSWTVCERAPAPQFASWTPYVLAVVELAEGVRMTTLLETDDAGALRAGMDLRPVFADLGGVTQLRYAPV
ncbi:MAG: OB-fold domain-containing protein [Pseudomonadales bacterium]|jgi:uncharacterized OB-fold protein|nr:OB-fold domain-containing protein [Pseudomonadales bacterium]